MECLRGKDKATIRMSVTTIVPQVPSCSEIRQEKGIQMLERKPYIDHDLQE
jgi:hypothetical protein